MLRTRLVLGWGLLGLSFVPWALVPLLIFTDIPLSNAIAIGSAMVVAGEVAGGLALLILGREAAFAIQRRRKRTPEQFTRETALEWENRLP